MVAQVPLAAIGRVEERAGSEVVLVLSGDMSAPAELDNADYEFARKPIELDDFLERVERLLSPTRNGSRP